MKIRRWPAATAAVPIALLAILGNVASAAAPASCGMRLMVQLTPDVPDPQEAGFLSSLLSNHPRYRLILRRERSDSVVVLDLIGPGPDSRCQDVVETMRRDGRVLFVHVRRVR